MRWAMSGMLTTIKATKKVRIQMCAQMQDGLLRMGLFHVLSLRWTARTKNERRLRTALVRMQMAKPRARARVTDSSNDDSVQAAQP